MTQTNIINNISNGIAVTNAQFLADVFKYQVNRAHVTVFHADPYKIEQAQRGLAWGGGHWGNQQGYFKQGGNQYFTISTFNPAEDGSARRQKALFLQTNVIVVDDVGIGLSAKVDPHDPRLPEPSYRLETSPDNEQWGYILSVPERSRSRVENLLDGMVAGNLCDDGSDPGMKGVTRYVRLPEGTNNKEKYIEALGKPFDCRMNAYNPLNTFSIEDLARQFNIDLDAPREEKEGLTIDDTDHPALAAYAERWGVKARKGAGKYDVICPDVAEHTDMDDSGTAIWTYPDGRLGFKCHHGHCDGVGGDDIMKQLYQEDPGLSSRIADYIRAGMFEVVEGSPPLPAPGNMIDGATGTVIFDLGGQCMDLNHEDRNNYSLRVVPLFIRLANEVRFKGERELYLETMARQMGTNTQRMIADFNQYLRDVHAASRPDIPWVDVNFQGTPLSTLDNYEVLWVSTYHYTFQYNTMTRDHEISRPHNGRDMLQDTEKLSMLTELKSLAARHGLKTDPVKEVRDYLCSANAYHPFHQYIDAQDPYTQKEPDYLQMLCDSIIVDPLNLEIRDTLIKTWMVSVVAASYMTWQQDKAPVRGILVLQGPQTMGKSYWFEHLLPTGMVKVGASINKGDMNHLKTATNRLIVELAEAEFTSRNMDMVAYIKSIVGRSVDELRKAYDAEEVQLLRRSVFCMTTNPGTFLMDDENSRFFTVPALGINRFAYNLIPMNRLWMQVKAMYDAGAAYLLDDVATSRLQDMNEQHRAKSFFEEWLRDTYYFEESPSAEGTIPALYGADNRGNWQTFNYILAQAEKGSRVDVSSGQARDILKRLTHTHTAEHTTLNGVNGRYWRMPAQRVYAM